MMSKNVIYSLTLDSIQGYIKVTKLLYTLIAVATSETWNGSLSEHMHKLFKSIFSESSKQSSHQYDASGNLIYK